MKKIAFTLSEVLLTLSIIGIVSAMTVPSLMTSIEDRELSAQAKKAYNTLQSAVSMKYALTRQTPADATGETLFSTFLANTSNAPTIKYNDRNVNVVQLPDGQIMTAYQTSGSYCGGSTSAYCLVEVDINGEDGPTFSSLYSGKKGTSGHTLTQFVYAAYSTKGGTAYARQYRDIVYFKVQDMTVTPYVTHGVTKRYFTGQQ